MPVNRDFAARLAIPVGLLRTASVPGHVARTWPGATWSCRTWAAAGHWPRRVVPAGHGRTYHPLRTCNSAVRASPTGKVISAWMRDESVRPASAVDILDLPVRRPHRARAASGCTGCGTDCRWGPSRSSAPAERPAAPGRRRGTSQGAGRTTHSHAEVLPFHDELRSSCVIDQVAAVPWCWRPRTVRLARSSGPRRHGVPSRPNGCPRAARRRP